MSSRLKFKSDYEKVKNGQNRNTMSDYKPLMSYKDNITKSDQKEEKVILQEVSVKNFIIQGHYSDKDNFFQMANKRK